MRHVYLRDKRGVTIIEMMVVIAVMSILSGLGAANVTGTIGRAAIQTSVITVVTNMRDQQLKAMVGDTEGRGSPDYYGVYLESSQYTLFHGTTYNPTDPGNLVIKLDNNIHITNITFPSPQIVFNRVNGEIVDYTSGSDRFSLEDMTSGQQKIIQLNRYGSVSSVN